MILFDDIEVHFEEDGPFLKSIVEFVKTSERPVVLTATQYIDSLFDSLADSFVHIKLDRPDALECANQLHEFCIKEQEHDNLNYTHKQCIKLSYIFNCDIRKCLNNIHFHGNAEHSFNKFIELDSKTRSNALEYLKPDPSKFDIFSKEKTETIEKYLNLLETRQVLDVLETKYKVNQNYHNSLPASESLNSSTHKRNCDETFYDKRLATELCDDVINLCQVTYDDIINSNQDVDDGLSKWRRIKDSVYDANHRIHEIIDSRIEIYDIGFHTEVSPYVTQIIQLGADVRSEDEFSRRRRILDYLDSIHFYIDKQERKQIINSALNMI